jgi:uncharacterized membrane protein
MKAKIENTIILFMGFSVIVLGCVVLFAIGSAFAHLGAYIDTLLF